MALNASLEVTQGIGHDAETRTTNQLPRHPILHTAGTCSAPKRNWAVAAESQVVTDQLGAELCVSWHFSQFPLWQTTFPCAPP